MTGALATPPDLILNTRNYHDDFPCVQFQLDLEAGEIERVEVFAVNYHYPLIERDRPVDRDITADVEWSWDGNFFEYQCTTLETLKRNPLFRGFRVNLYCR